MRCGTDEEEGVSGKQYQRSFGRFLVLLFLLFFLLVLLYGHILFLLLLAGAPPSSSSSSSGISLVVGRPECAEAATRGDNPKS
jgi:hypothetical protein